MKRYIKLFVITFIVIFSFIFLSNILVEKVPEVEVLQLKKISVNTTIACSGKVESSYKEEVNLSLPVAFKEVYFKSGDKVNKDDIIAVVDKEKTVDLYSDLAESFAEIEISDLLSVLTNQELGLGVDALSMISIPDEIRAPCDGTIVEWNIENNSYTNIQAPVLAVSESENLVVRIPLNENQLNNIEKGQYVVVNGTAFNDKFYGKITEIANSARQEISSSLSFSTVVDVFVSLSNSNNNLKPGLTANTEILTDKDEDVIIAPYEAVSQDIKNQEFVYVFENNRAIKKIIKTGREFQNGFEVTDGLKENDLIIMNPDRISQDGIKVNVL